MSAVTDRIRTVAAARELTLDGTHDGPEGEKMLLAGGRLADFASAYGWVNMVPRGGVSLDSSSAALLGLKPGDSFLAAGR